MHTSQTAVPGLRLAELLASLSLAIDLGLGQPMEHFLRACLLAVRHEMQRLPNYAVRSRQDSSMMKPSVLFS